MKLQRRATLAARAEALRNFGLNPAFGRRCGLLAALVAGILATGCHAPRVAVAPAPPARWVISDHGAVGDGVTVNTRTIQAAIDACAAGGGGVIVVPPGVFLSGALYFKPGVNLEVERDGVLKSTIVLADFPPIYTRWEGIERYWTSAFLNFVGMKNVSVTGNGVIDGSGDAWSDFGPRRSAPGPRRRPPDAEGEGAAALPMPAAVYPAPLPTAATLNLAPDPTKLPVINAAGIALPRGPLSPPRALVFQECSKVRVSGLTLKNEARWGFVFIYCTDVVADHLTVRAEHYIPSSDGLDVDSCRRVLITGCDIDCNDDCISLKSGKDEDGRRVGRPCEDVVIEKTRFGYGHGGAAMGSETSGDIRRVEVRDCVAEAGNWAPIRFKTQPTRGGVVEDITYRNIELRDTRQAFEFSLAWNMRIATPGASVAAPRVHNVNLINIHGTAVSAGSIVGLAASPIDHVRFVNCVLSTQRGLVVAHTSNLDLTGLKLTVAEGPVLLDSPAPRPPAPERP